MDQTVLARQKLRMGLQSEFAGHRKGYLTSLDWSQAFDRMRPAVSIQALPQLNFAPRFIQLLHGAWIHV